MTSKWDSFGIDPKYMKFPEIADAYSGRLIIAASGRCVWDDLQKAGMVKNHDTGPGAADILCVNDMLMYYPGKVEHAYSNNHKYLPRWEAARRDQYLTKYEGVKHTHSNKTGGKHTWPWPGHGTSSLNAVYTGIALGYNEIWLCGVPLDDTGHFFEAPWEKTNFVREVADRDGEIKYWGNAQRNIFDNKVRSFSGRTRELLGAPHDHI